MNEIKGLASSGANPFILSETHVGDCVGGFVNCLQNERLPAPLGQRHQQGDVPHRGAQPPPPACGDEGQVSGQDQNPADQDSTSLVAAWRRSGATVLM